MIVWRDRETGPVHPSIRSAPSTGTFGMSLSVTTFMMALLRWRVFKVFSSLAGQDRCIQWAARRDQPIRAENLMGESARHVVMSSTARSSSSLGCFFGHRQRGATYGLRRNDCGDHLDQRRQKRADI